MRITRITQSSTQPLYQFTAQTNAELEELQSLTVDQLADRVSEYNYGGLIKRWFDDGLTIQVFID